MANKSQYPHRKQVRLIQTREQALMMFDERPKDPNLLCKEFTYHGKILGIPAKLSYDSDNRYWLATREES